MKIAIPVEENNIETAVCPSFGRTPYFLIYDTQTKMYEFMDNSAAASLGGAGIKAAQAIVDANVEALLTPRCGENAAEVLQKENVRIYKIKGDSVRENIDLFQADKLPPLLDIHPGFHNHGGQ